jgi:hypothetical protein
MSKIKKDKIIVRFEVSGLVKHLVCRSLEGNDTRICLMVNNM